MTLRLRDDVIRKTKVNGFVGKLWGIPFEEDPNCPPGMMYLLSDEVYRFIPMEYVKPKIRKIPVTVYEELEPIYPFGTRAITIQSNEVYGIHHNLTIEWIRNIPYLVTVVGGDK